MKAYRIVLYVFDIERYGIEEYKAMINNAIDFADIGKCSSADIGEWSDEHPCNQAGADMETLCDWKEADNAR